MASLAELLKRGKKITPFEQADFIARLGASLPANVGGLGLPLSNTAMERAKKLSFNVDTLRYHGSDKDFDYFDAKRFGEKDPGWYGRGVTTDTDPEIAAAYANYNEPESGQVIYPLLTRGKFLPFPAEHQPFGTAKQSIAATKDMQNLGYAGSEFTNDRNLYDNNPDWHTEQVVFDPKNVRSRFAAFDPFRKNEANLLASHPAATLMAAGGLAGMARSALNEPYDPTNQYAQYGMESPMSYGDVASTAVGALPGYGDVLTAAQLADLASKTDWKKTKRSIMDMFK
jgi:hypothetical protein